MTKVNLKRVKSYTKHKDGYRNQNEKFRSAKGNTK